MDVITKVITAIPGIVSAVMYIWSRATAKASDTADKPGYKTSEFWLTVALNLPAALAGILGR